MVVYSGAPIKMGEGIEEGRKWGVASLPRQAEDQQQRAIQLFGRFRVNAANNPPNSVAA
jgi:hypothetical protein